MSDETLKAIVAQLWMDSCQSPTVAPDDNFFSIGGNSMQMVRMLAAIADHLDIELEFDDFFLDPRFEILLEVALSAIRLRSV